MNHPIGLTVNAVPPTDNKAHLSELRTTSEVLHPHPVRSRKTVKTAPPARSQILTRLNRHTPPRPPRQISCHVRIRHPQPCVTDLRTHKRPLHYGTRSCGKTVTWINSSLGNRYFGVVLEPPRDYHFPTSRSAPIPTTSLGPCRSGRSRRGIHSDDIRHPPQRNMITPHRSRENQSERIEDMPSHRHEPRILIGGWMVG